LLVFENGRSHQLAEISDDLICLLVNVEGKVLERDDEFWREFPLQKQRESGAVAADGPPWIAKILAFA
jgi:hypothetical protein